MRKGATSRQLLQCMHIMEDSAYMPEGSGFASSCTREASQFVQTYPRAGVDQPGGGPPAGQGRPPPRMNMAAGVDEKSSGQGSEAAKDPAIAIAACPEVTWRLEMGWWYGCRF
ncbi:g1646 [Coccomyxa elongata]